jgi:hypothetical protein
MGSVSCECCNCHRRDRRHVGQLPNCLATSERYGAPGHYVVGANLASDVEVADAMVALGVI